MKQKAFPNLVILSAILWQFMPLDVLILIFKDIFWVEDSEVVASKASMKKAFLKTS